MTPKEALDIIKRSIQNLEYNDILDQEALLTISKVIIELKELEELKRDVKRFNELRATFRCAPETLSVDDIKEYEVLSDKIWKVGNEK